MFEELTFETLLNEALARAPKGVDTRPGSIYYDAVVGVAFRQAKIYVDMSLVAELVDITTATGKYLDRKAGDRLVYRLAATSSKYFFEFEGDTPEIGERFYTNGLYFVLKKTSDNVFYLEAEEPGTFSNSVYSGTPAIPVNNIPNLISSTFGELMDRGTDEENDEDLRERLRDKISGPAENGNKQHYRTWCEEVEGVGRARIIPLWKGPNTVKGIIIDPNGTPAMPEVVKRVQEYVDPDEDGDGEGDGLGEGVANLGAHFTAVAPDECVINISFDATLKENATVEQVISETKEAVAQYFQNLTLNSLENEVITVYYNSIYNIVFNLSTVEDYTNLTVNGSNNNIIPTNTSVAVVGEVVVNVI